MAEVNVFYRAKRANPLGNAVAEAMALRADTTAVGQPVWTVIPASGKLIGAGVYVAARGRVIVGAAGNVTLNLRVGTTLAGQLLASTGAVAFAAPGNFNFELVFEGDWDATSQQLMGKMYGHIGRNLLANQINSNAIVGFDPNGSIDMQVIFSGLFSVSNAANDIRLDELVTGLS